MSVITKNIFASDEHYETELGFVGWAMLLLLGISAYFLYGLPLINELVN